MKRLYFFSLLFLLISVFIPQHTLIAETKVLKGKHIIIYDIVNPLGVEYLPNYTNKSFKQEVLASDEYSKRLLIEIDISPLNSSARFPIPIRELPGNLQKFLIAEENIQTNDSMISEKAKDLVKEAKYAHEAFTAIADWLIDNIIYDAGPNVRQDAKSVMITKRGSCVGITCLSIAMLRSVGIPARYAHGYLPPGYDWGISKKYWGVKINGGGFHAWIEVYYPDIGWTFSDLEHSKNFVDPFHVLRYIDGVEYTPRFYKGGEMDVENATTYTIFREENTTVPIDKLPSPKKVILGRQIAAQQFGTIYGSIIGADEKIIPEGKVTLWKGAKGFVFPFEQGKYSVIGLEAGNYRVVFEANGYTNYEENIKIKDKEIVNINVRLNNKR
ncbi:MAG: transglutaminase domain-containing protein [Pseudomonadota bacterium]